MLSVSCDWLRVKAPLLLDYCVLSFRDLLFLNMHMTVSKSNRHPKVRTIHDRADNKLRICLCGWNVSASNKRMIDLIKCNKEFGQNVSLS